MQPIVRKVDSKGRITLDQSLTNSYVMVEKDIGGAYRISRVYISQVPTREPELHEGAALAAEGVEA